MLILNTIDESLTNEYKLFVTKSKRTINSLVTSKKYIMIEEFKDDLRGLKTILKEIKKPGTIERTRNKLNKKRNKNETKPKLNMLDDEINDILSHSHSQFLGFQINLLSQIPLSINTLHSHLHLPLFQRCYC